MDKKYVLIVNKKTNYKNKITCRKPIKWFKIKKYIKLIISLKKVNIKMIFNKTYRRMKKFNQFKKKNNLQAKKYKIKQIFLF